MALPLTIYNPQTQSAFSQPQISSGVTFGGNANGPGATTATTGGTPDDFSNILFYGIIALGAIFVIQLIEKD